MIDNEDNTAPYPFTCFMCKDAKVLPNFVLTDPPVYREEEVIMVQDGTKPCPECG
jgi:hypothetical protein